MKDDFLHSNGIHLNLNFDDIEVFNQTARAWDLQFKQLETGKMQGFLQQLVFPHFQLGRCYLDKHIHQLGSSPPGYWTFIFSVGGHLISKGKKIGKDEIVLYKSGSEINAVTWSGFDVITLSLKESTLGKTCDELELPKVMKLLRENEVIRVNRRGQDEFRNYLLGIFEELQAQPLHFSTSGHRELFDFEIPRKLCQLIEGPGTNKKISSSPLRESALQRAIDFVSQNEGDLLRVSHVCQVAKVSERTLQYAFREYYGISPKKYLEAIRLNNAHRLLNLLNPDTARVNEIAYQTGFWHLGKFAADYKRMFGELPSTTLKREMSS